MKSIFSTAEIGTIKVKNRLIVPAMVMGFCNADGTITDRFVAYHAGKARGGWGLIITEDYAVDPRGIGNPRIPGLWNDEQVQGNIRLTEEVHKLGGKIAAQLYHAGRQTNSGIMGAQPVAPSPLPCPVMQEMPHELTINEIQDLVEKFGDSAKRAKDAGFDGVEIHGGHGYLVAQFISAYSNKRTDVYGGILFNRLRFATEIIANIKKKAGDKFPVIFRLSGKEMVPGGMTIEDSKAAAMILEQAGADAIHVSVGTYGSRFFIIPPAAVEHGWITDLAAEIKKVVSIPVITVGRINDPLIAEGIIRSGKADFIAMGRASLADPDLPRKAARGDFDDIIPCIGCLQGCWGKNSRGRCILNPRTGKEKQNAIIPANKVRKVLIAGGGPGGMETAIVAAKRGHEVHLYEKTGSLGGQFSLAAVPPSKGEISSFIAWQSSQLVKLGVKVNLDTELTEEIVSAEQPDAVVVATGSRPLIPDIPGINRKNVVTAQDVLAGQSEVGRRVIVAGGGMIGAETASYLANHGKQVAIIEMSSVAADDEEAAVKYFLMDDLKKNNVKIYLNAVVKTIEEEGVIAFIDDEEKLIGPVDTVVLALGVESVNILGLRLQDKVDELYVIGDALQCRKATEAIEEGYHTGLMI